MNDIFDIKSNILWWPIDFFYSFLYIIFFIIFFFLIKKFSKKPEKILEVVEKKFEPEKINFSELLKKISFEDTKEKFYSKISFILKNFLEEKNLKPISKMTFKEIKNLNLEKNLENLIKEIYFSEFKKDTDDNLELRKKIFEEVKNLINKK